jgi:electron transport complex protein RnfD
MPPTIPLWMLLVGSFTAIVVVKQMFGGIGHNFVNPAITGRIVMLLSFTAQMTAWNLPNGKSWGVDAVASATPLHVLSEVVPGNIGTIPTGMPSLLQMLLGQRGGSLGETCALGLLAGFVYLLARKVISPLIPLSYVGTVAVLSLFATHFNLQLTAYEILGGGLLLGAVFMATDYTTCPLHWKGKLVYGVGCGLLTCLMRFFGNMPEAVSFAILLMNLLTPHIENIFAPKPFGTPKKGKRQKGGAANA